MPERHPGLIDEPTPKRRTRMAKASDDTDIITNNDDNSAAADKATATPGPEQGQPTTSKDNNTMTTTDPTPAELSRLALAEAKANHAAAVSLHDQRGTAAEKLRASLTSGRASLADLDQLTSEWVQAIAAEQVAAMLTEGCEANVKRAEHALINDDTTVADLFADVVAEVYGGRLPVQVLTIPADVKPNDNGDPVLFIVQPKAPTNKAGILSANLELTFYRPPLFAPLDGARIEQACRERNYAVEVGMWSTIDHGEFCEDPARARVKRIYPSVPTLFHAPDDGKVSLFANDVRNRLRNAVTYYGERDEVHLMGEPVEGRAQAEPATYKVISRSEDKDNNHRMAIEVVCKVTPDKLLMGGPVGTMLREAVNREVGNMAEGIGRIVAIDHTQVDVPDLTRRFANPDPFVVTAHFGIMYRVG